MIDIDPIHIIGVTISVALIFQSVKLVRNGKENVFEFLLWVFCGSALFSLSVSNAITVLGILDFLQFFLRTLGFSSGRDGIYVLAILALLLLLFYTYISSKTNRKKVYDLNQELAILQYEIEQLKQDETNKDG